MHHIIVISVHFSHHNYVKHCKLVENLNYYNVLIVKSMHLFTYLISWQKIDDLIFQADCIQVFVVRTFPLQLNRQGIYM